MGRTPCCSKMGLNRGPWTPKEDNLLSDYITKNGEGGWRTLPKRAGLLRCGKSCRLRWMNYLRPDVKRGQILPDEEDLILRLHRLLGNRWSLIAGRIPGRTDNEIKNYWNTHLSRKLISQGIDPRTHKPLAESELGTQAPLDGNSNKMDSENSLTSVSDSGHKNPEAAIVHGNIEAFQDNAEDNHSAELEHPETSVAGSLHSLTGTNISNFIPPLVFEDTSRQQDSSNVVNMNRSLISESGLQGIDASLYLRRNSITNSYFMAPPPVGDIGLQSIPSFPGSIFENAPYEGSSIIYEQYEMQQRQVRETPLRMDVHHMTQFATTEECNPDMFSYFMESFMGEDQVHEETNKHGASSVSGNRQQFSHEETTSQLVYDMWSTTPPPSEFPLNARVRHLFR